MVNVLFVCLGNICRSPLAAAMFRDAVAKEGLSDRISVDSAAVGAWQIGAPADPRAQATARARGVDLSGHVARQIVGDDFRRFEYVLAMDFSNTIALYGLAPPGFEDRLSLFLEFAPETKEREVPDPYYGDARVFERAADLIELGARGLLRHLKAAHFADQGPQHEGCSV